MSSRPDRPSDKSLPSQHRRNAPRAARAANQPSTAMLATAHYPPSSSSRLPHYNPSQHAIFELPRLEQPEVATFSDTLFAPPTSLTVQEESRRAGAGAGQSTTHSAQYAISSDENVQHHRHDSASSDGQEDGPAPAASTSNAPNPPPKKKRTRTLTTSHQSSVLLALLARTPFPTTAEREEVGRAIGLTARKVQVWFQNQRQKQKKASQSGTLAASAHQTATTSAPLPLSRQPGFSAHHAARMGVQPPMTATTTSSNSPPTPATATYGSYTVTPPPVLGYPRPATYYPEQALYFNPDPKSTSNPGSRPQTSHSNTGSAYAPQTYFDPYNPQDTRSYGHSSASHTTSLSNEYSLPPPSEASTQSPGDTWRYKPLPPLPAAAASAPATTSSRPTRGYSLNLGDQGTGYRATPPTPASASASTATSLALRSRAFSNPGTISQEYTPQPQSQWYQSTYMPTGPIDSQVPTSYHPLSTEYEPPKEGHFYPRYAGQRSSPGGLSSASSYADPPLSAQTPFASAPTVTGRLSHSPVERRRTRLSYDSAQVGGSVLGKRPSWSTDEERVLKRPRTGEGHSQAYTVTHTGPSQSTIYHPPAPTSLAIPPLLPVTYPLQPPTPQQLSPQQQATPVTPSQQQRIPEPPQGQQP